MSKFFYEILEIFQGIFRKFKKIMVTILSFAYVEINYAKENLRENTSVFFEP